MPRRVQQTLITPTAYFEVALAVLADDGYAGLKLATLCRRLGVTSGSFYHHFDGWPAFVDGLLRHWEAEQTQRVLVLTASAPDPRERVRVLKEAVLDLPHAAEAAIRVWSGADPVVRAAQRRVDDERWAGLREVIAAVVPDGARADRLATLGLSLFVGWQQVRAPWPVAELSALLDDYERSLLAPP